MTATATATDLNDVVAELLELDVDPLGRPLEDAAAIRAGIPDWHPRNDEDDDDDGKDDDDNDDDDDTARGKGKDDDDDDDDDDRGGTELERAQRAVAKANSRRREAERERDRLRDADEKEKGKHKERADRLERELEELRGKVDEGAKRSLLEAAAERAGFRKPAFAFKLAKADGLLDDLDVDDETAAKRIVRDLAKDDPDLLKSGRRTRRGKDDDEDEDRTRRRGSSRDDDDEDDDDEDDDDDRGRRSRNGRTRKGPVGPERLKAHFGESGKGKKRGRGR